MSCPVRNLAVFRHYCHYEGLGLLPSVCDSKLIQQTLISQLHDLMDKLTALNYSPFYRVGKSLIINRDYIFKVNPGLQRIILSNSRLEKDILIKASKDALKNLKEKLETEEELTLEKEGGNS